MGEPTVSHEVISPTPSTQLKKEVQEIKELKMARLRRILMFNL